MVSGQEEGICEWLGWKRALPDGQSFRQLTLVSADAIMSS